MKEIIKCIENFDKKKIMVIGDVMLDSCFKGTTTRISPEAPIPIVKFVKEENIPGGAGNCANNISTLGGNVFLVGVVGKDEFANKLSKELAKNGIDSSGLIVDETRPTTVKKRVISGDNHQIVRLDYEDTTPISLEIQNKITNFIKSKIKDVDAVVISDYSKGLIDEKLAKEIIKIAKAENLPIVVDSKSTRATYFQGVTLMTPNLKEAKEIAGISGDIEKIAKSIIQKIDSNIFITRGADGITLVEKSGEISHFPTKEVQIFDVSGAGDTVVAISTLCLTFGMGLKEIAKIANVAGKLVIQKPGTATVSIEELKNSLMASMTNATRQEHDKVWGKEDWIVNFESANYCGKRLVLNRGYQCSIHYHKIKSEVFYINKGLVLMFAYDETKLMCPGESIFLEPGTKHRFIGITDSEIIEFSSHHTAEDNYRDEPSGKVPENKFKEYLDTYSKEIKEFKGD
ncbi:MAG: bifunctional hydroxymethylpyrimidine kinase/phosphomethylpyrimidine kinase [Nanoarchaeota archaeon]|nr:bifunctional hydroxymethylpyrimidine kinase/phosphomethylpyrimidine kinase [Nanoarchaeota archaeon]